MATSKLTVRHTNVNGSKANIDSDTATAIDTWARAYVNISTDTYQDSEIQQNQSVNDILAEQKGARQNG